MKLLLTSECTVNIYDENENKIGCFINTLNGFDKLVKKHKGDAKNFVFIPNDFGYEFNQISANFVYDALKNIGLPLQDNFCLKDNTPLSIKKLENADIIFLQGGTLQNQNEFLKSINFKNIATTSQALIIGKSAGAMNLQKTVYQYPESLQDLSLPKWLVGNNLCDIIIIPHFDINTGNVYNFDNIDLINNYYLPDSKNKCFYALPQGSYIFVDNSDYYIYGECYKFQNQKMLKINKNNNVLKIVK